MGMLFGRPTAAPISLRDLYFNAPAPATIKSRKPNIGERAADALSKAGVSQRQANRWGEKLTSAVTSAVEALTPVGNVTQGFQAGQDLRQGNYLAGGLGALLAALPVAPEGRLVRKLLATLPEPSVLNLPRTPTPREMAAFSRVDQVPLDSVRRGNALEWERFNSGDYGQPLVKGYSNHPIAAELENGEFVVLDGNHRTALAKHSGAAEMQMHVIPARQYDPENAGRASKPPSATEIDRLLAELSRP